MDDQVKESHDRVLMQAFNALAYQIFTIHYYLSLADQSKDWINDAASDLARVLNLKIYDIAFSEKNVYLTMTEGTARYSWTLDIKVIKSPTSFTLSQLYDVMNKELVEHSDFFERRSTKYDSKS
jgi:hypothetical protein